MLELVCKASHVQVSSDFLFLLCRPDVKQQKNIFCIFLWTECLILRTFLHFYIFVSIQFGRLITQKKYISNNLTQSQKEGPNTVVLIQGWSLFLCWSKIQDFLILRKLIIQETPGKA